VGGDRTCERIPAIGRAKDGAAKPQNAGDVVGPENPRAPGLAEAVETVFDSKHLDVCVPAAFDDGADDRIEARGIASTGQHADSLDVGHSNASEPGVISL